MVDESLLEEKRPNPPSRRRHRGTLRSGSSGASQSGRGRSRQTRHAVRRASACRGVTFHASRPTHASQPIDEGVEIVTIRKRLGHAKPDIAIGPQTSIGLEGAILRLAIR